MAKLQLTVATWDYDRVRPIMDGRVPIEGCDINFVPVGPEECFHRAWKDQDFDITELGICGHMGGLDQGRSPYTALPIHISRMFRHSGIFIRTDRGIYAPADLRGKRIGIPEWPMAAGLWIRGMLQDDHGVQPSDVTWVQGGQRNAGRDDKYETFLPEGFPLERAPEGRTLDGMLAEGELDGVMTARTPAPFLETPGLVTRLFEDFATEERDYYGRTGIYPIMHFVGIRNELYERHPWLAQSVVKAFDEAKRIAEADLVESAALKIGLPWLLSEVRSSQVALGGELWPYGVDSSRTTLDAMVRYAHEQGVTRRLLAVEELFAPSTYQNPKI